MKLKEKTGFTVVELLIGIMAAAVLAITAGLLLVNIYQGWARGAAAVELEREAAVAIHTLELAVRSASNTVSGGVGVDLLQVRKPDGVVRSFTVQTSNGRRSLLYNPSDPGGAAMVLVDNRLGTFVSATTGNMVCVSLTLVGIDQNNQDIGLTMECSNMWIRMRN